MSISDQINNGANASGSKRSRKTRSDSQKLVSQLAKQADKASDLLADAYDASVIDKTLQKIGSGRGPRARAAMANFIQATSLNLDVDGTGEILLEGSPASHLLLEGS